MCVYENRIARREGNYSLAIVGHRECLFLLAVYEKVLKNCYLVFERAAKHTKKCNLKKGYKIVAEVKTRT